jgi:hypothetical protein
MPYTIQADADLPPKVELTKPAADVTLPANGTLRLEGSASDDIGVKEVTLRLRLADGPAVAPKPYREGKSFQLAGGGYPKSLAYQDFLALNQLKDGLGQPVPLAKGMVLEYWLEAADACDYPAPNQSESKHYKVNIAEPAPDQEQQKERQKAADDKSKHEKQQDQQLKDEAQQRQEAAQEKAKENQKEQNGASGQDKPKEGDKPGAKQGDDKGLNEQAQKIKEALDKKEEKQRHEGDRPENKGSQDSKGDSKGDKPADQDKGEAKPQGEQGDGKPGASKAEGTSPDGKQPDTGAGKPEGAKPQDAKAGQSKEQGNGDQQSTASAKPDGSPQPDKGDKKGAGQGDAGQNAAAAKEHGNGPEGMKDEAVAKGPGQQKPGEANDPAAAKGDQKTAQGQPQPGDQKRDGQSQNGGNAKSQAGAKDDPKQRDLASELRRRENDVRGGTEQERADAEKWLENLSQNAKDQEVRDLAKQILNDAKKDRESSPALPKGQSKDDAGEGPPAEGKGGKPDDSSAAKSGGQQPGEGKSDGGQPDVAKAAGHGAGSGRPNGASSLTKAQEEMLRGLHADEAQPSPTDVSHHRRPGVLQIEDFTKIDKDILKDLKMSPEDWEAFKKAYTDKLQREQPEQLPGSRNDVLGSRGAKEHQIGKTGSSGDRTGQGQVPAEFRPAFRTYTKGQAEKK